MANKSLTSMFSFNNFKQVDTTLIGERVLDSLSLDKLKKAHKFAIKTNNSEFQKRIVEKSIIKFPNNTFGYSEKAKFLIENNKYYEAWKVLNQAPHNKEIATLIKKVSKSEPKLSVYELSDQEKPTLAQIGKVYELALESNNVESQEECIAKARLHFPRNKFSYIEEAKMKIRQKQFDAAWGVLNDSPNSEEVESLKEQILSYDNKNTDLLKEEVVRLRKLIKLKPLNFKYHDEFFRFLSSLNKHKEVNKLVKNLPFDISSLTMKTRFSIIESFLSVGDQESALQELLSMQKKYPMDRRVLFKISDIYKFDKQTLRAYVFLLLGESTYPTYGAIKRLTFESDHNMFDKGTETFDRILDFKDAELVRFLSIVSRVSCFYPEKMNEFTNARAKVRAIIEKNILKDNITFNKNLKLLLSNRWFVDAKEYMQKGMELDFVINDDVLALYNKIEENLVYSNAKDIIGWLELADKNEIPDVLLGMLNGSPVDVNKLDNERLKIEFFIPNAFFTPPENEKPTFKTAQQYFRTICRIVESFDDVVVIPRHQFNWRKVYRKTDFKAISYHTFNEVSDPDWLHVQESTLANRCSVDTKGFAGYSKMATDFSDIEKYTKDISNDIVNENFSYLYQEYVVNNVSKYHQKEKAFYCDGDYVFVALQVLTDLVADIAFFDGMQMLKTIAEYYKNTSTTVVVKRHPYCNSLSMQLLIEELLNEGAIIVSDASIHSIIENAKAVFVVNSGVGFEALMHLKPVIVCGQCDYAYAVSNQVETPKELLQYLETEAFSVNEQKVKKLLYYYAKIYNPTLEKLPALLKEWIYDQ